MIKVKYIKIFFRIFISSTIFIRTLYPASALEFELLPSVQTAEATIKPEFPMSISANGSVIAGVDKLEDQRVAFIWREGEGTSDFKQKFGILDTNPLQIVNATLDGDSFFGATCKGSFYVQNYSRLTYASADQGWKFGITPDKKNIIYLHNQEFKVFDPGYTLIGGCRSSEDVLFRYTAISSGPVVAGFAESTDGETCPSWYWKNNKLVQLFNSCRAPVALSHDGKVVASSTILATKKYFYLVDTDEDDPLPLIRELDDMSFLMDGRFVSGDTIQKLEILALTSNRWIAGTLNLQSGKTRAFIWLYKHPSQEFGIQIFETVLEAALGKEQVEALLQGWQLLRINGVSADGLTFIGVAELNNGSSAPQIRAFRLKLDRRTWKRICRVERDLTGQLYLRETAPVTTGDCFAQRRLLSLNQEDSSSKSE